MKKYTIILSYNDGLYTSQVNAHSESEAIFEWLNTIVLEEIPKMNLDLRDKLKAELEEEFHKPILLDGLKNVFSTSCTINNEFFLINIIETIG